MYRSGSCTFRSTSRLVLYHVRPQGLFSIIAYKSSPSLLLATSSNYYHHQVVKLDICADEQMNIGAKARARAVTRANCFTWTAFVGPVFLEKNLTILLLCRVLPDAVLIPPSCGGLLEGEPRQKQAFCRY